MTQPDETPKKKRFFANRSNRLIALVIGAAVAIGGAVGLQAASDTKAYAHMKLIASGEGGWHGDGGWRKAGWRHGRHGRWHEMSDSEIEARIERMVKHVAIEIDATAGRQGDIELDRARISIGPLAGYTRLDLRASLRGPLRSTMRVLDMEPLELLDEALPQPDQFDGTVSADLRLDIALVDGTGRYEIHENFWA